MNNANNKRRFNMMEYKTPKSRREVTLSARSIVAGEVELRGGASRSCATLFSPAPEESLVVDDRCGLTPAQAVEGKLMNLLRDESLPVSQLQIRGLARGRTVS